MDFSRCGDVCEEDGVRWVEGLVGWCSEFSVTMAWLYGVVCRICVRLDKGDETLYFPIKEVVLCSLFLQRAPLAHSFNLNAAWLAGSNKLWVVLVLGVNYDRLERCQRPALHRLGKSGEACVANVIVHEPKCLRMAHHTKGMNQENAHAKSEGMGTRQ